MVKNLRLLANKFELHRSDHKSTQATAGTHKSWPNSVSFGKGLCVCFPKGIFFNYTLWETKHT